jgi:LuxR family maltose regulon positive regulatory protein
MGVHLLPTKLSPPPLPPGSALVPRSRLVAQLDAALPRAGNSFARRLTLVSAPPGYGKTTLIADWRLRIAESNPESAIRIPRFAWLSLDADDNEPHRFLSYLVAAAQTVAPQAGQAVQQLLQAPRRPPLATLLAMLIADLAAHPEPFALVLDDYHLIQNLDVHESLAFLTDHQPPQMHLVLITREDPPLPLARLRAQGQLTEIRQDLLGLTPAEAKTLLNRVCGLALSEGDIALLQSRTEGWIVGLRLAALALGDQAGDNGVRALIASFDGRHHFIIDYLMEEVFSHQPPAVQSFLLQTAILDRFTASLCDAVTGRSSSRQLLHSLANANLFLQPLDARREWYRYHQLFADLLRHRLQLSDIEETHLHAAAGHWYAAHQLPREAIPHLLRAGDGAGAGALLETISGEMMQLGEISTLLRWLRRLPADTLARSPNLRLQLAWALALAGQLDAADAQLFILEELPMLSAELRYSVVTAQAHIARSRHDLPRTIALGQKALRLIAPEDHNALGVAAVNLGIAYWNAGRLAEARAALLDAGRSSAQSDNHYALLMANSFLALIAAVTGRLREAEESCRHLLQTGGDHPATGMAHLALGCLALEAAAPEEALPHLEQAVALSGFMGNYEMQSNAYQLLALARSANGDHQGALAALAGAQETTGRADLPPHALARNAACAVQLALARNDLAAAESWARQATLPIDPSPFFKWLHLAPARLALARGDKLGAATLLAKQAARAEAASPPWRYGLLEVRLLQALAAPSTHQALTFMDEALDLTGDEPFVHSFTAKGEPMHRLLRLAASQGKHPERARRRLAEAGLPPVAPLVEPLSQREQELLALLAKGHTNAEIALALVVTVNTVKTHLRHIYEKLDVHNRRDAIQRAQTLGLLDSV